MQDTNSMPTTLTFIRRDITLPDGTFSFDVLTDSECHGKERVLVTNDIIGNFATEAARDNKWESSMDMLLSRIDMAGLKIHSRTSTRVEVGVPQTDEEVAAVEKALDVSDILPPDMAALSDMIGILVCKNADTGLYKVMVAVPTHNKPLYSTPDTFTNAKDACRHFAKSLDDVNAALTAAGLKSLDAVPEQLLQFIDSEGTDEDFEN